MAKAPQIEMKYKNVAANTVLADLKSKTIGTTVSVFDLMLN